MLFLVAEPAAAPPRDRGGFDPNPEAIMSDPRNVAHDKTVQQEKKNHGEEAVPAAAQTPQPGKKPPLEEGTGLGESYQQHAHHQKADKSDTSDE